MDRWEDKIDQEVLFMIQEVMAEVRKEDPVKKEWNITRSQERGIWCDANSLAPGTLLEMGRVTAEDAAWIQKKDNSAHIKVNPNITMEAVKEAMKQCRECQSIDPAHSRHEKGELHMAENWKQLVIDNTRYCHELYLSMIDCGPRRVVIWRRIRTETAKEIERVVEEVFLDEGPVKEELINNNVGFCLEVFRELCKKWGVRRYFRFAYCLSCNGIIERHHQPIKAVAKKSQISPQEAVFWYNMVPQTGQDEASLPH